MGLRLDWQIVFFLHCYLSHLHRFCLEHMFETLSLMFGAHNTTYLHECIFPTLSSQLIAKCPELYIQQL